MALAAGYLTFRSTSKASDEAICLASILGMDTERIISSPSNIRMDVFWRAIEHIPSGIIFSNGKRLEARGLRWAPSTLLGGERFPRGYPPGHSLPARLTEDGLQVQFSGWLLGWKTRHPIEIQFYMIDTTAKADNEPVYEVTCLDDIANSFLYKNNAIDPWVLSKDGDSMSSLAVISRLDLSTGGDIGIKASNDNLLILAHSSQNGVIHGRYVSPVRIVKLDPTSLHYARIRVTLALVANIQGPPLSPAGMWRLPMRRFDDGKDGIYDMSGCRSIQKSHIWCID